MLRSELRRAMLPVVLGSAVVFLDMSIVNVALATLGRDFRAPVTTVQWTVSAYALAVAAFVGLAGWASRRFGTKRLYIAALAVFTLGSACCGLATSPGMLIAGRVIQGAGGGMLLPTGQMILIGTAGAARLGRALAAAQAVSLLAPIAGPGLGGVILDGLGWRWIFLVNLPLGVLALLIAARLLPSPPATASRGFDAPGFLAFAVGLPLLLYAAFGLARGAGGGRELPLVAFAIVLLLCFVARSLRASSPALDVRVLSDRALAAAAGYGGVASAGIIGTAVLVPLFFQEVKGLSATAAGSLTAAQAVGILVGLPVSLRLNELLPRAPLATIGAAITIVAMVPLAAVSVHTAPLTVAGATFGRGLAISLVFVRVQTGAYARVPAARLADATPLLGAIQQAGGAIGAALTALVLQRGLRHAVAGADIGAAYGNAFAWNLGLLALSAVPAALVDRAQRRRLDSEADSDILFFARNPKETG